MSKTDEQMPLEIWTDINGNATRTQFKGGAKYIRADECAQLREQNRVYKEALQFYADPQTYGKHGGSVNRVIADGGATAKAALTATSQPISKKGDYSHHPAFDEYGEHR